MRLFIASFGRALLAQLHIRMLWLTVLPFIVSLGLWGVCLWLGLQPIIDWLQGYFVSHSMFGEIGGMLAWFGMGALKTVLVPLLAMWTLLPLMILTALVFVGLFTIPAIARHIGTRHYPMLDKRHGGSVAGSLWTSLWCFAVFTVLWLATIWVFLIPPLAFVIHSLLWGWLTYRVMAYDTLADYASAEERRAVLHLHRWPLLAVGTIAGALGAAPTLLWLGGVLSVILLPALAAVAIWLYVVVFVFTGLWFQFYCLEALLRHRSGQAPDVPPDANVIDVTPR